jgi:hypothetical protein
MSKTPPHQNSGLLGWAKKLGRFLHPARNRWILLAYAFLFLLVARPVFAADLSGTWEITYRTEQGRQTITLEIVHGGSRVSGSGIMRGDSGAAVVQVEVQTGTARDGDFRFLLVGQGESGFRGQEFTGNWFRNEMSGQTDGVFGSWIFTGTRYRLGR